MTRRVEKRVENKEDPSRVSLPQEAPHHLLWQNEVNRPYINLDSYRARVRRKFALNTDTVSVKRVKQFTELETALAKTNAGLRQRLDDLSYALSVSDAERESASTSQKMLNEKMTRLLAHLPIGVIELDCRGIVTEANPAALAVLATDHQAPAVVARPWCDVVAEVFSPKRDDGYEISLKNGRMVHVQTQSLPDRRGQLILIHDQTHTRTLQTRLARHERLAALGRTTATLAHQVRTPLCGALLYLSQVMSLAGLTSAARQRVQKAQQCLHHLERQVKQILLLSRGEVPLTDRVTVQAFFTAVSSAVAPVQEKANVPIRLHMPTINSDVSFRCHLEALVGCVLNLVENAVAACDDGEAIEVSAWLAGPSLDRSRLDEPSVDEPNLVADQQEDSTEVTEPVLHLVVRDSGCGMDEETRRHVLEPFFTTRQDGTGLGMSVVRMVVNAHRGSVQIDSQVGKGTRIELVIPLTESIAFRASPEMG